MTLRDRVVKSEPFIGLYHAFLVMQSRIQNVHYLDSLAAILFGKLSEDQVLLSPLNLISDPIRAPLPPGPRHLPMMIIVIALNWVDFIVLVEELGFQSGVILCVSLCLAVGISFRILDGFC